MRTTSFDPIFQFFNDAEGIWNAFNGPNRCKVGSYPPYNIVRLGNDDFVIEVACAGFSKQELEVTQSSNILRINGASSSQQGKYAEKNEATVKSVIHDGLARRDFRLAFQVPPQAEVASVVYEVASVVYVDGVLTIRVNAAAAKDSVVHDILNAVPTPTRQSLKS